MLLRRRAFAARSAVFLAVLAVGPVLAPRSEAGDRSTLAVAAPVLKWQRGGCFSSWCQTGWYSSPAVADLDGDGHAEVIWGSYDVVALDGATGALKWRAPNGSRVWPGIAVADLTGDGHARGDRRPRFGPGDGLRPRWNRPLDPQSVRRRRGPDARGRGPRHRRDPRDRRRARQRRRDEAAERLRRDRERPPRLARAAGRRGRLRLGDVQRERRGGGPRRRRRQGADRPDGHPLRHGARPRRQPAPGERDLRRGQGLEPGGRPRGPRGRPAGLRELRRRAPSELGGLGARRRRSRRGRRSRDRDRRQRLQLRDEPVHEPLPDALRLPARPDPRLRRRLGLDGPARRRAREAGLSPRTTASSRRSRRIPSWPTSTATGRRKSSSPRTTGRSTPTGWTGRSTAAGRTTFPGRESASRASRSWRTSTATGTRRCSSPRGRRSRSEGRASCTSSTTWAIPCTRSASRRRSAARPGTAPSAAPTLADVDGDGELEAVVGTVASGAVAYDLPGTGNARVLWGTGRGSQRRTGAAPGPAGPPLPSRYHALAPCRVLDTRRAAGPLGGPSLAAGARRLLAAQRHLRDSSRSQGPLDEPDGRRRRSRRLSRRSGPATATCPARPVSASGRGVPARTTPSSSSPATGRERSG